MSEEIWTSSDGAVIVNTFVGPGLTPWVQITNATHTDLGYVQMTAEQARELFAGMAPPPFGPVGAPELFGALRYLIRRIDLLHKHGYYDTDDGRNVWGDDDAADRILVAAAKALGINDVPDR